MNLSKLFELQKVLDERIVREKGLVGQDLLPMKILALQVELGELANEWRGFKFWSNDQEPRREKRTIAFANPGGPFEHVTHPLLEEYVDCLHFILSIGLELGFKEAPEGFIGTKGYSTTDRFIGLMMIAGYDLMRQDKFMWACFMAEFQSLGQQLGFTWDEVEQAYFAKNAVNHERQTTGY